MREKEASPRYRERILVVDDEKSIVAFLVNTLEKAGFLVTGCTSPKKARELLAKENFDLAIIDLMMPDLPGSKLAREILESEVQTEILIMTGVPEESILESCLEMGISQYIFKPFQETQVIYSVFAALHHHRIKKAYQAQQETCRESAYLGVSFSSRDIRRKIFEIANTSLPVLIVGESGTGKEIIARDLHRNSARSRAVFLPVNCATLGSLAESELFGHVSGAFTGANRTTAGYVGTANRGSLFLDEIGELSLEVQAKLLRFLDNGEYIRVGENQVKFADVRIIAATNRDLEKMISENKFREDLYYRLAGEIIRTHPLRDRKSDIPPLVWHFLEKFGSDQNRTFEISADAMSSLMDQDWPGNVRQLRQTLHKVCELAPRRHISGHDVIRVTGERHAGVLHIYRDAKEEAVRDFDTEYFSRLLIAAQGSLKRALELSGMHKKNFYDKIKQLGMSIKTYAAEEDN